MACVTHPFLIHLPRALVDQAQSFGAAFGQSSLFQVREINPLLVNGDCLLGNILGQGTFLEALRMKASSAAPRRRHRESGQRSRCRLEFEIPWIRPGRDFALLEASVVSGSRLRSSNQRHMSSSEIDMTLPNISLAGSVMPIVLPERLRHFLHAVDPSSKGRVMTICGACPKACWSCRANQKVEFLVSAARAGSRL